MSLTIRGREVGRGLPLFVVAELGLNHAGDPERALAMVDAAAEAGASAVKIQSFRADRLVASSCPPPAHVAETSLRSFFRSFELDDRAAARIAERAHRRGLALLATPFDEDVVDRLEAVGCDAYKIASGDLTHHALIESAAATGKPIVLSTGMADLAEVHAALDRARAAGARHVAVLHCVSAYPIPAGEENVLAIDTLHRSLRVPVGLSDHSTEPLSVPLAVALGACVYERHFALDGVDDQIERAVSSTPSELHALIQTAERARRVLGNGAKTCRKTESGNRQASRRSLHVVRDLEVGDVLDASMVVPLRPATGVDPTRLAELIGRRLVRAIAAGAPLAETDLAPAREGEFSDVA